MIIYKTGIIACKQGTVAPKRAWGSPIFYKINNK